MDKSVDIISRWSLAIHQEERSILDKLMEELKNSNDIESFNRINFTEYFKSFNQIKSIKKLGDKLPKYSFDNLDEPNIKQNILNCNIYEPLLLGLKDLDDPRILEQENSISAAIVLYSMVALPSIEKFETIRNVDQLISYIMIYILADELIDGPSIDKNDKIVLLQHIKLFIKDPKHPSLDNFDDKHFSYLRQRFNHIVDTIPRSQPYLLTHFITEIEAHKLQKNSNLEEDEYLHICEMKGGNCAKAIFSIIDLPVDDECYEVGCLIQLCDDLLDIDEDLHSGIHTIVTYTLLKYGNLDILVHSILNRIDTISNTYCILKPWFTGFIICSINSNPEYYSTDFKTLVTNFYCNDKTQIIKLIHLKFLNYSKIHL